MNRSQLFFLSIMMSVAPLWPDKAGAGNQAGSWNFDETFPAAAAVERLKRRRLELQRLGKKRQKARKLKVFVECWN